MTPQQAINQIGHIGLGALIHACADVDHVRVPFELAEAMERAELAIAWTGQAAHRESGDLGTWRGRPSVHCVPGRFISVQPAVAVVGVARQLDTETYRKLQRIGQWFSGQMADKSVTWCDGISLRFKGRMPDTHHGITKLVTTASRKPIPPSHGVERPAFWPLEELSATVAGLTSGTHTRYIREPDMVPIWRNIPALGVVAPLWVSWGERKEAVDKITRWLIKHGLAGITAGRKVVQRGGPTDPAVPSPERMAPGVVLARHSLQRTVYRVCTDQLSGWNVVEVSNGKTKSRRVSGERLAKWADEVITDEGERAQVLAIAGVKP